MSTLVTGADGYLGRKLLRRLLDTTDDELVACVRATDSAELARKRGVLERAFPSELPRLTVQPFDVARAAELPQTLLDSVQCVLHTAAVTAFGVARERAREVNVVGTGRALGLARRCPKLERCVVLSTLYSSGLRAGDIPEAELDDSAGFANHYEWSKWAAERLTAVEYADLPWQVHRVGTVLCDNAAGHVGQLNITHDMWRLLYRGLLPLVPGTPTVSLPIVTGELAAQAICEFASRGPSHAYFHVCLPSSQALPLEGYVDAAYDAFLADADFRRRRVLRPLFIDAASFYQLSATAGMFSSDSIGQVAELMRPFTKQLFIQKRAATSALTRLLGPQPLDVRRLVEDCCRHLLRHDWRSTFEPNGCSG